MSDKWLETQCSLGASIHLTHAPGVEMEFVADGDRTKIDSYDGLRQASSLLGGHLVHANGNKSRVIPKIRYAEKCELLEIADFCSYAAQRYWHIKSDHRARTAHWRSWYKSFNFMFARYAVGVTGQFVINAVAHTPTPR